MTESMQSPTESSPFWYIVGECVVISITPATQVMPHAADFSPTVPTWEEFLTEPQCRASHRACILLLLADTRPLSFQTQARTPVQEAAGSVCRGICSPHVPPARILDPWLIFAGTSVSDLSPWAPVDSHCSRLGCPQESRQRYTCVHGAKALFTS